MGKSDGMGVMGDPEDRPPFRVLLADPDPRGFQDRLLALIREPVDIILIDPGTPTGEMNRIVDDLRPDRIFGSDQSPSSFQPPPPVIPVKAAVGLKPARILIPTGGTTGRPRFAIHTWDTLDAAAAGFGCAFPGPTHSLCVLPLWHVGGLMQLFRARRTGARFDLADWRRVEAGDARPVREGTFLSLVPTQLQRLLEDPTAGGWLRQFRAVFLGGAGAWSSLLDRARDERIPLAPAYGMTETAAQVCTLRPNEFLSGRSGVGRSLPHARLSVVDEEGNPVRAGEVGRVRIESTSLFIGYEGEEIRSREGYLTDDLGTMDDDGYLSILGRSDDMINTGGEKVMPAEVEAAIRASGLAEDVVVCGRSDPEWGESVCALIVSRRFPGEMEARKRLEPLLVPSRIPRCWIPVAKVPRNALGKLDRRRAADLIGMNDEQERSRRDP